MTGVNISLPSIQKDFVVPSSDLQWLISAYTLTVSRRVPYADVVAPCCFPQSASALLQDCVIDISRVDASDQDYSDSCTSDLHKLTGHCSSEAFSCLQVCWLIATVVAHCSLQGCCGCPFGQLLVALHPVSSRWPSSGLYKALAQQPRYQAVSALSAAISELRIEHADYPCSALRELLASVLDLSSAGF